MFGIGPMEFLLIAFVAVVFVGPDKLPEVLKKFGRFYVQAKRHANDVKSGFDDAIHQAERDLELERIREIQKDIARLSASTVIDTTHTDHSVTPALESQDEGHTPDGRLIEPVLNEDGTPKVVTHGSAMPLSENEVIAATVARERETSYHEGHLPAHLPNADRDPFAAETLTNSHLHEQDEKTAQVELEPALDKDKDPGSKKS